MQRAFLKKANSIYFYYVEFLMAEAAILTAGKSRSCSRRSLRLQFQGWAFLSADNNAGSDKYRGRHLQFLHVA